MEAAVRREYKTVLKEVEEIRSCITDYMKMFFTIGVGVVAVFAFFIESRSASGLANSGVLAYVPLMLAYITLTFASILFHKFNTHNRGCGYLRALEVEVHAAKNGQTATTSLATTAKPLPASPARAASRGEELRLWQSVLAAPFQERQGAFDWGHVQSEADFHVLEAIVKELDKRQRPFWYFPWTIIYCARGFWMIARATVFRSQTRSWTFPFQVAFGPFVTSLFLVIAWLLIVTASTQKLPPPWLWLPFVGRRLSLGAVVIFGHVLYLDSPNLLLQIAMIVGLVVSWLGLFYRLFRLCAENGDRTIEAWCWRAMAARRRALGQRNIVVHFVGLIPSRVLHAQMLLGPRLHLHSQNEGVVSCHQAEMDAKYRALDDRTSALVAIPEAVRCIAQTKKTQDHFPYVSVWLVDAGFCGEVRRIQGEIDKILVETGFAGLCTRANRGRAEHQALDALHTTLVTVRDPKMGAAGLFETVRGAISDLGPLTYEICGAHLTPELDIIMELREPEEKAARLRTKLAEEVGGAEWPNFHHATISRLYDLTPESAAKIEGRLRELRAAPDHRLVVTADQVKITHLGEPRFDILLDLSGSGGVV